MPAATLARTFSIWCPATTTVFLLLASRASFNKKSSIGLPQTGCSAFGRADLMQCLVRESQFDAFHLEEFLELSRDGVLGSYQDLQQVLFGEGAERTDHRESSDEFRDQPEFDQILRLYFGNKIWFL